MGRGYTGAMMRAYGAGEWVLTVLAIEDVTPHYRRITVHAPGMFDGTPYGAGSYLRLWIPDPDDPETEFHRAYTMAEFDEATEQIVLEFVLHEPAGPASRWAARARVGDQIATTRWGAPRFVEPAPAPAGYLLVADIAGLPAVNGILAEIPADTPVDVYLEYSHDDDLDLPVVPAPGLNLTWVRSTGEPAELLSAIAAKDYSEWFAWVTAESTATKIVRDQLKDWGFPRSHLKPQGYWTRGKAMGTSRSDAAVTNSKDAAKDAKRQAKAALKAAKAAREAAAAATSSPRGRWRAAGGTQLLAPLKRPLIVAGVVQALVSLAELTPFVLLAVMCSRMLDGVRDVDSYLTLAWWAVSLMSAAAVTSAILMLWLHLMDARFGAQVRSAIVQRIARVPLGWFTDRNSGTVRTIVQDDVNALHALTTHAVTDTVAAIVAPLAILICLVVVHPGLAFLMLLPLIGVYFAWLRMYNAASWGMDTYESWRRTVSAASVSHLEGIVTARIYDRGPDGQLGTILAERSAFLDRWQRPLTRTKTAVDLITRPTTMLAYLLALGVPFHLAGWISSGDLVLFLLVATTFGARLLAIMYGLVPIRESLDAAGRIARTLAEPTLTTVTADTTPEAHADCTVTFDGVTFGYDPDRPVIDNLSLRLEPGTVTALVGPSGSGKSTLAALLARFYDVQSGRILLNGTDIRDLPTSALYRTVGFVLQGPGLIHASLHDNIALGRPEAAREQVVDAARTAQLHDRIMRLERGYDAVVGLDAHLSGGEAQRVAIARAILADPTVLVLDEATAHADPESEHLVQTALSRLVPGRTVLVVTHRLHSITGVDNIVVLQSGHIVQQGRHDELVEADGLYRALWSTASIDERESASLPAGGTP